MSTPEPKECPHCKSDLDGGPIPEEIREHYSPPYRFSRAVSVYDAQNDRHDHFRCPDCSGEWQ